MQVILSDILMAKKSKRSLALTGTLQFFGFGKKSANCGSKRVKMRQHF
jgi:hypothetical protein